MRNYLDWKSTAILFCVLATVPLGANGDIPPLGLLSGIPAYSPAPDGQHAPGCSITAGSKIVRCAPGTFTRADVGKMAHMQFAGAATGCGSVRCPLVTTIAEFVNSSTVALADSATNTSTNQILTWGTDDTETAEVRNASTSQRNPLFWDENGNASGKSPDCPSSASESAVGTIPAEAFKITNTSSDQTTPEPSSILLLGSGILCLAGVLRRNLPSTLPQTRR